jgi:hypothetical protein
MIKLDIIKKRIVFVSSETKHKRFDYGVFNQEEMLLLDNITPKIEKMGFVTELPLIIINKDDHYIINGNNLTEYKNELDNIFEKLKSLLNEEL